MLSKSALEYLSTLHRETPLPTAEVARLLIAQEVTPYATWLDFHETYAGYFQDLGMGDIAVWGLARANESIWFKPRTVTVERLGGEVLAVYCADVHGSHGYSMKVSGVVETPLSYAKTFDIHVERLGLWREFALEGPRQMRKGIRAWSVGERAAFIDSMLPHLRVEASDEFVRYFRNESTLVIQQSKGALEVFDLTRG